MTRPRTCVLCARHVPATSPTNRCVGAEVARCRERAAESLTKSLAEQGIVICYMCGAWTPREGAAPLEPLIHGPPAMVCPTCAADTGRLALYGLCVKMPV